jgi:hypothetical protein
LRKVKALYDEGVKGGEAETYYAWKFYVAKAESWLIAMGEEVIADPDADWYTRTARAKEEMLDAAKNAYEAAVASFGVGVASPSEVHQWSHEWMARKLQLVDFASDETTSARRAHLYRMRKLFAAIKKLHDKGAEGGEEECFQAARYYVEEAEFELSNLGG